MLKFDPATADGHTMRLFSRSSERTIPTEEMRVRLEPFDKPAQNPVKDEIAGLREQRDAGTLSEGEYTSRVARLLGAIDPGPLPIR